MRIVFMGTPDFAAASLEGLYRDGHDVAGVFTQPDKPRSRGMKLAASPVKKLAEFHGTPVFQPATLRYGSVPDILKQLRPELIAVAAYGKLLPKNILELPELGCVNVHGSVLPKYRGSAPIQRAVLNGEKTTGVTTLYMSEEMDAGDIIAVKTTEIGEYETSGGLYKRLGQLGAELLSETVESIGAGTAGRTPQNAVEATFAPPLSKEMSAVDWTGTSDEVINQIRGLDPWPTATAEINGVVLKLYSARRTNSTPGKTPGSVVAADREGIEISCADGTVRILEVQAPGGKRMAASDYLRGHPICL